MSELTPGRRRLVFGASLSLVLGIALAWLLPDVRPGDPALQSAAIVGSVLLSGAYAAALAKRFGRAPRPTSHGHVWLACIGFVLVAAHSTGELDDPPALLLAALLLLGGLGIWARTRAGSDLAQVFGGKFAARAAPGEQEREALARIIEKKVNLLARLEPESTEAVFSIQPRHWLCSPRLTAAYWTLARKELELTGAAAAVPGRLRYWRAAHQLIAAGFILGLLTHVVVVTFFAAYAAEGDEIYWWHITAWNF